MLQRCCSARKADVIIEVDPPFPGYGHDWNTAFPGAALASVPLVRSSGTRFQALPSPSGAPVRDYPLTALPVFPLSINAWPNEPRSVRWAILVWQSRRRSGRWSWFDGFFNSEGSGFASVGRG